MKSVIFGRARFTERYQNRGKFRIIAGGQNTPKISRIFLFQFHNFVQKFARSDGTKSGLTSPEWGFDSAPVRDLRARLRCARLGDDDSLARVDHLRSTVSKAKSEQNISKTFPFQCFFPVFQI